MRQVEKGMRVCGGTDHAGVLAPGAGTATASVHPRRGQSSSERETVSRRGLILSQASQSEGAGVTKRAAGAPRGSEPSAAHTGGAGGGAGTVPRAQGYPEAARGRRSRLQAPHRAERGFPAFFLLSAASAAAETPSAVAAVLCPSATRSETTQAEMPTDGMCFDVLQMGPRVIHG